MTSLRTVSFLLSLLLLSCSSSKFDLSKPIDPQEVIRYVNQRNQAVMTLAASGRLSIDTPELSNSGSMSVRLVKPDTLLIDISGPFGVGVAKGLLTNKSFVFFNSLENTVVEGETNARNLQNILRISIEFSDILDVLTGTLGFSHKPDGVAPVGTLDGSDYKLLYKGSDFSVEYTIDMDYLCIKKFVEKNSSGDIVEVITFRDFRKKSDIYIPAVISISRPLMEEALALVYDRQTINSYPLDFTLKIPKSARKITF